MTRARSILVAKYSVVFSSERFLENYITHIRAWSENLLRLCAEACVRQNGEHLRNIFLAFRLRDTIIYTMALCERQWRAAT